MTRRLREIGTAAGRWGFVLGLAAAVAFGCGGKSEDEEHDAAADSGTASACPWDKDDEFGKATGIDFGKRKEGYICPKGDQDWYKVSVPGGVDLVTVDLSIDAPVSPIDPTYSISDKEDAKVIASANGNESAVPEQPLKIIHSMTQGDYLLLIRDQGNDGEDVRHAYAVLLSGSKDKDANEPNNSLETATAVDADTDTSNSLEAYVSFRGDEDWYKIECKDRNIIGVNLTMPAAGIEPAYRIIDSAGGVLFSEANEAGKREATALSHFQSVEKAGAYYVVVSDNDKLDGDPSVPYRLALSVLQDPDKNEGNDSPDKATGLASSTCGAQWSQWISESGYLASSGDIDWYKIDLSGCGRGIIEAEASFAAKGSLPDNLELTVRLVHAAEGEACDADQDCTELSKSCDVDIDCSKNGNTCLSSGFCAGAGACLSGETCGAAICSEMEVERGEVDLSAPLFGASTAYLAVQDYHSDSQSLDNSYSIRVRVIEDPDVFEESEAYTAGPPQPDDKSSAHMEFAEEIPVHDCRPEADGGPSCCDDSKWVQGYLAYKYDQDWYKYQHPCPSQNCMLRFVYDFDQGPNDFYVQVYREASLWFDTLHAVSDQGDQPADSGHYGGMAAGDKCFYAFAGHEGEPFYYYLAVRDTVYVSDGHEEDGAWDRSTEQAYRFCMEKIADGCNEPCKEYDGGLCDVPPSN